ncbi:MAG: thioredoxin family protein [Thermoanaerobaculia bacterium]
MTRRIALAAALALALAPQTFAGGPWLKTVASAQKVAKEKNQLILVDMFAEWCGWCHRFEREVFPSEVFQKATEDIVLLRLDTEDKKEGTEFQRKYQVSSLPTFLLLTPDLTLAGAIRGYAPPTQFVKMLGDARTKHEAFEKRVKNEPAMAKDYPGRLELAKEFVTRNAYDKSEARLKALTAEKGVPGSIRDEAFYQLAFVYALQNKFADALKTIKALTAVSKRGDAVERSKLLAGQIYVAQGNLAGAVNELRAFKKSYPNSPHVHTVDAVLPDIERRLTGTSN